MSERAKAGLREGLITLVVNTLLFILKIWASIVTGSIALAADAWHTLSDSLSSLIVITTSRFATRKADKEHPFGHGRWEMIASIFIAILLGYIAIEFFTSSITKFNNRESVEFGLIAIIATVASIIVKEAMAQYAFYVARKSNNTSVRAHGWHHRSDAISSVVVLVGIFLAPYFWWIDSALGVAIALMLIYVAFKIIKEAITRLLGEEPDAELINSITAEVKAIFDDDLQLHHIHLHNYISQKEMTMHIRLKEDLTIGKGHFIATGIEKMIKNKFDIEATIHVEPLMDE
ncbi:MAG: cation diffusion facilitator family transporter [Treponema sp.]|nr:cation diffusion facilitator family transporter [Treponema sp.]